MPVQLLVRLAAKLLGDVIFTRVTVLSLWEVARRTPGKIDDAAVQLVAAAVGVKLPATPEAPGEAAGADAEAS